MTYIGPMQQIKASIPDDLRAWLRLEAQRREVSESSVIRMALRNEQVDSLAEGKENGKV